MSTKSKAQDLAAAYNEAIEDASILLLNTAKDYDQMVEQLCDQATALRESDSVKRDMREYREKARLLRGQAQQILAMKSK